MNLTSSQMKQDTMTQFTTRQILKRRETFKTPIHHGNFFPLRHLKRFTETQIMQLVTPGMQVADIGCGDQPFRPLIESLGAKYVGIDITQNQKGTVDIISDIAEIATPAESFDLIICTEVLEHSFDPHQALGELARTLKPSGVLLLTTPFIYPLHEVPYDFTRSTPFFLEHWLPTMGFQKITVERFGNELEVISVIWGSLWVAQGNTNLITKSIFSGLRAALNLAVLMGNQLLSPLLKSTAFTHIGCVAYKSAASNS